MDNDAVTQPTKDRVAYATRMVTDAQENLTNAEEARAQARTRLHECIVKHLHSRVLRVSDMARATGFDRNYIDAIRSSNKIPGVRTLGRADSNREMIGAALFELQTASEAYEKARTDYKDTLSVRNEVVVLAYETYVMGPSALAKLIGCDRNHVMRIARTARQAGGVAS